jgi:hypothetical protein
VRRSLLWLAAIAGIVLIVMTGMFWIFYTLPIVIFLVPMIYYIAKSSYQRIRSHIHK